MPKLNEATRTALLKRVNDGYGPLLDAAFMERFKTPLKTEYNIIAERLVSLRPNNEHMSDFQTRFIAGYERAFTDVMLLLSKD